MMKFSRALTLVLSCVLVFSAPVIYGSVDYLAEIETEIKECRDGERRIELAKIASALRLQKRNQLTPRAAASALMAALWLDLQEIAKLMIPVGAGVVVKDKYGFTPLTFACASGNLEMVEALVKNGADTNEKITIGLSDLFIIKDSKEGSKILRGANTMRMFVEHADSNDGVSRFEDKRVFSALSIAASLGDEKMVEFLLENKSVLDAENDDECAPLASAAFSGKINIVKSILRKGAKIDSKVKFNYINPVFKRTARSLSALEIAARCDYLDIVKLLVEYSGEEVKNLAMIVAAGAENEEVLKFLIEKGTDVNAVDDEGKFALISTGRGNEKIVRLLIEAGADVNLATKDGMTALMRFSMSSFSKIGAVKLLIDSGADVNAKDQNGFTPLMSSADMGKPEIVKLLLDNGAEVNAKDHWGYTALIKSLWNTDNPEVLKLLIDSGADVNAKTQRGDTALTLAVKVTVPNVEHIKWLLKAGADVGVNVRAEFGEAPSSILSYCMRRKRSAYTYKESQKKLDEIIRLLKSFGARE